MSFSFHLSSDKLQTVFPFYLLMAKDLTIVDSGPSLKKMIGNINDLRFNEQFKIVRPRMSFTNDWPVLADLIDQLVIVETIHFPVKTTLRGQFLEIEESGQVLYLCTPWFTSLDQLAVYGLTYSDFALNDTLPDLFNVLKSNEIVTEDLELYAAELIEERNKLRDTNKQIEVLAKFHEQNPQPVLRIGMDGELLYFNQAAAPLVQDSIFSAPDQINQFRITYIGESSNPFEFELPLGEAVYSVTCVPFLSDNYYNLYLKEITQIIQYQKEIETVNFQFSTLINSMRSGLLVEDLNRKIIMVNDQFCEFFGIPVPKEQMVGFDCEAAGQQSKLIFQDEEGFLIGVHEAISGKKVLFGEQLKLKDGRVLERDYIPLINDNEILGHIWKYIDITEDLNTKESLRRVEDKYKKIIEELQFGLLEVDLEQRITRAFPAFCAMTGYTEEELIGQFAHHILSFEEESEKVVEFNEERKKGVSGVYETRIKTKSGEIKTVIISGSPIFSASGEIVGSIGVHIDITDRKKLENELRIAQEKAYTYVRAKDMFVAKISHEIRTPMNVIIGLAELLSDSSLDEEQSNIISSIRLSASNLLGLINDILDFSTLENKHYKIQETSFDVKALLEELNEVFTQEVRKKGLEMSIAYDSGISSSLVGDKQKLNQVLVNLLGNAIKFTEEGFIRLSSKLIRDEDQFQLLQFEVLDSGIGISKESLEDIFDDFKQESDAIAIRYGGSGLGLAISQMIISEMGGEIKVNSEKGKGAKFYFDLELKKGLDVVSANLEQVVLELNQKWRILVAEDNVQNQFLIKKILEKTGVSFTLVENGLEVLDVLGKEEFDLILMDIQMPKMNGLEALIEIRKKKLTIPVIALTANASSSDREKYMNSGFNGVVVKPYTKMELFSSIHTVMQSDLPPLFSAPAASGIKQTSESTPLKLYALSELELLIGDDREVLLELMQAFVDNIPKLIDQIISGIATADGEKVKFALHQIKPSLKIFKADDLHNAILDLDQSIQNETDFAEMASSVSVLREKCSQLISAIEKEMT
jgi:PAS domain S-box-containing protein